MSDLIGAMWAADADPDRKSKGWSRNAIIDQSGLARQAGVDVFALREFYGRVVDVLRAAELPVSDVENIRLGTGRTDFDEKGCSIAVVRSDRRVEIMVRRGKPGAGGAAAVRDLAQRAAAVLERAGICLDYSRADYLEGCMSPVSDGSVEGRRRSTGLSKDRAALVERRRELQTMNKPMLAARYRELGGQGGEHPVVQWEKDEIIDSVLSMEFPRLSVDDAFKSRHWLYGAGLDSEELEGS